MAQEQILYGYQPSHVAPAIFVAVIGISLLVHIWQNFRYSFWRVTFWMFWGGTVFTAGWVMRLLSSYNPSNLNLYIAQTCLVLCGPPIYAAAEYNILGRLMHYLPMHAPLNPNRLITVFIYLGAAVESLTAAGASLMAGSKGKDLSSSATGGRLISISLVLQGVVECVFIFMVALMHHRAARARMLSHKVRTLCIMLYGTASLVLIRCIFRAIAAFATDTITSPDECGALCRLVNLQEWYLYVFEAVPMALYTIWLNLVHPGRYLPRNKLCYLDTDGSTERLGPGWIDRRSRWETFADPFDIANTIKGRPAHEKFWLRSEQWPTTTDGRSAQSSARNNNNRSQSGKKYKGLSTKS